MAAQNDRRSRVVGALLVPHNTTSDDSRSTHPLSPQCLSEENYIIAHYDLRPPNVPAYGVSGNTLTLYEAFSHLCMGKPRRVPAHRLTCV